MEVDQPARSETNVVNIEGGRERLVVPGSSSYTSLDFVEDDAITMMAYREANHQAVNQDDSQHALEV